MAYSLHEFSASVIGDGKAIMLVRYDTTYELKYEVQDEERKKVERAHTK